MFLTLQITLDRVRRFSTIMNRVLISSCLGPVYIVLSTDRQHFSPHVLVIKGVSRVSRALELLFYWPFTFKVIPCSELLTTFFHVILGLERISLLSCVI